MLQFNCAYLQLMLVSFHCNLSASFCIGSVCFYQYESKTKHVFYQEFNSYAKLSSIGNELHVLVAAAWSLFCSQSTRTSQAGPAIRASIFNATHAGGCNAIC
jgi:hypothetical protein